MNVVTNINEWKEKTIANIKELDKKESFYCTIPGKKIGELGGFATHGYIGKFTSSITDSVTYYAAKELKNLFQSWQWHTVFADDINKRLDKDELNCKIHSFKTLSKAINFLFPDNLY